VPVFIFSKESIMKSSKFFAVAALCAVAALSSVAQAAPATFANNGEIATAYSATSTSTLDRAAVRAQGVEAARMGQIRVGDFAKPVASVSTLKRADVRADAVQALHAGAISTGDVSAL
jgi:hypothetical protein